MTNMPPGGFSTQGANTFRVDSLEMDPNTERKVRNLLSDENKAFEFFQEHFSEYFPKKVNDLDLLTPKNLKVRYYPYRFYCANCGRTFITDNDLCPECYNEMRQLTEIYLCENCGEIFEPPVPKVCMNPNHIENEPKFIQSLNIPRKVPKYETFKFRALPELHWQCKDINCKAIFNYHQKWSIDLPKSFINKPFSCDLDYEKPIDIAKHYQYRPESKYCSKEKYENNKFNPARYYCQNCTKSKIKAKNVPSVRNTVLDYIINDVELMKRKELDIGYIDFNYVNIISLSREYVRKFYTKEKMKVEKSEIFSTQYSFLTNTYGTHAAYVNINSSLIDEFINTQKECIDNKCEDCKRLNVVPDSKITQPKPYLEEWELEKVPDMRRKWCGIIKDQGCQERNCEDCPEFRRREHLKYLLIHALKHALILSMPKYLGVNKNEIRGIIYPNGKEKPELVFLDVHEDGSGSFYLMKRNWPKIWDLSEEVIKNVLEGKGSLLLPQFCERHNVDLCPIIASNFYKFLRVIDNHE